MLKWKGHTCFGFSAFSYCLFLYDFYMICFRLEDMGSMFGLHTNELGLEFHLADINKEDLNIDLDESALKTGPATHTKWST